MPQTVHIPINQPAKWNERGHSYPETASQWRGIYRNRVRLGLEGAFLRIGKRIVVDEAAYLAAAREAKP